MDNGTYHKAYTSGAWSISWDSPGGKTSSKPAAAFYRLVAGCASVCFETDILLLVVRGMDNNVYWNSYSNLLSTPSWGAWSSLSGKTGSAPTLAFDANYCDLGSTGDCSSIEALGVLGTDNAVYHKTYASYGWSVSWDSPGGSILNSPALAYIPGSLFQFSLVAEGVSTSLYSNTVTFNTSTWGTWVSLSGASTSDPALVAIV
jgi:hypothetical protein